jgi:hypothetical protein
MKQKERSCHFKGAGFKSCLGKHVAPTYYIDDMEFCGGNYDVCAFYNSLKLKLRADIKSGLDISVCK